MRLQFYASEPFFLRPSLETLDVFVLSCVYSLLLGLTYLKDPTRSNTHLTSLYHAVRRHRRAGDWGR